MNLSKTQVTPPPDQQVHKLAILTYKEFAQTWRSQGFTAIDLEFYQPTHEVGQLKYLTNLIQNGQMEEAIGYMAAVLKSATVPGVVQYTFTGR